jgi:hypothetical protein
MNLRPNAEQANFVKEDSQSSEVTDTKGFVKTSVTLPREVAVKAKEYVHQQQLLHTTGQRQHHYSFSQFVNDALNHYLETLEKGESYEKIR